MPKSIFSKRTMVFWIIGLLIAASLVVLFYLVKPSPPAIKQASPSNFNTITDTSTGLSFNISKRFEAISREKLSALNPEFSYGFQPANDPNALCVVSQARLSGHGTVSAEQLRDGILGEVRHVHADARLLNEATALSPVKFGNAQGILLEIAYREGRSQIRRVEVIALGKTSQVIAYCQSLSSDNQKYYADFSVLFSSLRLAGGG